MAARTPEDPDRLFALALKSGQSVEVARRQADGTWLFVIDTPWGLESAS